MSALLVSFRGHWNPTVCDWPLDEGIALTTREALIRPQLPHVGSESNREITACQRSLRTLEGVVSHRAATVFYFEDGVCARRPLLLIKLAVTSGDNDRTLEL